MTGFLALLLAISSAVASTYEETERCFPDGFLLGTATAAYQVEGGWNLTGRTPSIWDDFCRSRDNVQCANVADDMIHRYKSDIELMKSMGLSSFRFSISWSRVMSWNNSTQRMVRNDAGIEFYHNLLDSLVKANLTPIVTLYHWDLPSALHTHLNGWVNPLIVDHFNAYASLMYDEYGSKVVYWTTFNEPWSFCVGGYGEGYHAPGWRDSDTNTYLAAHNVLLSHAAAVATFRLKGLKDAKIGITLNSDMAYPLDPSNASDLEAAERKLQFSLGWFLNPIANGDYPAVMKKRAGPHLPRFTPEQSELLRGSYDAFMLNHYSSNLVTDCGSPTSKVSCDSFDKGWQHDLGVDSSRFPVDARPGNTNTKGEPLCSWFNGYPQGYLPIIKWMHAFNTSAPILLTENGWCGNSTIDNQDQLWYYQTYLDQVWQGLQEGIPIIGYTAWSFVDNYEWGSFEPRFGLFHVDFPPQTGSKEGYEPLATDLNRTARPAATWFGKVAKTKCLNPQSKEGGSTTSNWVKGVLYIGFFGPMFVAAMALLALVYRKHQDRLINEKTPLMSKTG